MFTVTLPAQALRNAFAVLTKLVPDRVTLPVLGFIHVERVENRIFLTGTDLDRWLTFNHLAEPDPITTLARTLATLRWPREAGALLVPKTALRDALRAADKDGSITFTLQDAPPAEGEEEDTSGHCTVRLSYEMNGQPIDTPADSWIPDRFPPVPEVAAVHSCVVDIDSRSAILEASQFTSTDTTRYVLNGVHVETRYGDEPCAPTVVATDGRRLYSRHTRSVAPLGVNMTIPTGAVDLLGQPALLGHDWKISTGHDTQHARIVAGPWTLVTRLIEGNFPNYRQVIPSTSAARAPLGSDPHRQLVEILGKLPVPPKGETESITLRFHRDRLGIEDPHSRSSLIIPGVVLLGPPKVICLNRFFLRELLATGPGTFHLIDEMSPLRYETARQAVHVVMPMRSA